MVDNPFIGGSFRNALTEAPQVQQENPLMAFFREWVQAKQDFDDACISLQQAAQRKAEAQSRLGALIEKAAQINGSALQDPTAPQAVASQGYENGQKFNPMLSKNPNW